MREGITSFLAYARLAVQFMVGFEFLHFVLEV